MATTPLAVPPAQALTTGCGRLALWHTVPLRHPRASAAYRSLPNPVPCQWPGVRMPGWLVDHTCSVAQGGEGREDVTAVQPTRQQGCYSGKSDKQPRRRSAPRAACLLPVPRTHVHPNHLNSTGLRPYVALCSGSPASPYFSLPQPAGSPDGPTSPRPTCSTHPPTHAPPCWACVHHHHAHHQLTTVPAALYYHLVSP